MRVFGYWNPMGFIPKFCLTKILCSIGIWRIRDEEAIGYMEMNVSRVLSQSTLTLSSTCSRRFDHSSVDLRCYFDESSVPIGFLQQTCTNKHRAQVETNRMETQVTSHSTRSLQESRQFPKACNKNHWWIQCILIIT